VERSAEGDRSVVLEGWGSFDDPGFAAQTDGTGVVRSTDHTTHAFEVDVVREGGLTTTIDYAGTIGGTYGQATTWNGSGIVSRDGLVSPTGTVRVQTVDEVMDDAVCQNQPISGETTVEQDGDTAFVRYDGATDCDADRAAVWGFDGEDRGTVTGVDCSSAAAPVGGSAPLAALLLAAFLTAAYRRQG
jgi:hypothetical protein